MEQGEIGDSMFIIFKGECGVYINQTSNQIENQTAIAVLGANSVTGDKAVMNNES